MLDGQFHHIVVTHDGASSNARVEIWIDGVLRNVATDRGQIVDNDMPLMIGENPDAQNREWEGVVDDVAIWGRPLTADEIRLLWAGGNAGRTAYDLAIPEPCTLTLLALGGLGLLRRRRRI